MIWIIIIISFVLDSIFSNFIHLYSLFFPLFTVMSLILIFPYFNGDREKYYLVCFLTGLAYDLIYTDTIIINAILFLCIGFIIVRLNLFFSNNYVNVVIMGLFCIIFYRLVTFGLLIMTGNIDVSFIYLIRSIYRSIVINVLFVSFGYIVTNQLSQKFKIKKAN